MIYPFTDDEARHFPDGYSPSEKYRSIMQDATDKENTHAERMARARRVFESAGSDLHTAMDAHREHQAATRDYEDARAWRRMIHPSWFGTTSHADMWQKSG